MYKLNWIISNHIYFIRKSFKATFYIYTLRLTYFSVFQEWEISTIGIVYRKEYQINNTTLNEEYPRAVLPIRNNSNFVRGKACYCPKFYKK